MKPHQVRITSDGTGRGTKVETHEGVEIKAVMAFQVSMYGQNHTAQVELKLIGSELDIIADCVNIEELAKELHEAGRTAVENGNTVAAEKFGEQTRKFIEWEYLSESAKDGRRIQAVHLLQRYHIRLQST